MTKILVSSNPVHNAPARRPSECRPPKGLGMGPKYPSELRCNTDVVVTVRATGRGARYAEDGALLVAAPTAGY